MARKLVERSPAKPGVLIVTYMAEHCHPVPTQLNALAGTTRHKSSSSGAAALSWPDRLRVTPRYLVPVPRPLITAGNVTQGEPVTRRAGAVHLT